MKARAVLFLALLGIAGCQEKPFQPYSSADGKFETKFPGEPKISSAGAAGVIVKMYSSESWNRAFMVGWSDLPIPKWETEGRTKSRLFDARDGALAAVNAKSNGTTKTILLENRFPGIEFGGVADGKHVRARAYLVGHRMYQVLVVGRNAEVTSDASAEEFFAAFKVVDVEGLLPEGSSAALPAAPPAQFIESTNGRFQAKYPEKPAKFNRKIGENEMTGYSSESPDSVCSIGYADLQIAGGESAEKVRERLDAARSAALADAGGTMTSEKEAKVGSGAPGLEFTGTAGDKRIRGRVFLVGARLYQITVVGTEAFTDSKDATAFLDSFQLK